MHFKAKVVKKTICLLGLQAPSASRASPAPLVLLHLKQHVNHPPICSWCPLCPVRSWLLITQRTHLIQPLEGAGSVAGGLGFCALPACLSCRCFTAAVSGALQSRLPTPCLPARPPSPRLFRRGPLQQSRTGLRSLPCFPSPLSLTTKQAAKTDAINRPPPPTFHLLLLLLHLLD